MDAGDKKPVDAYLRPASAQARRSVLRHRDDESGNSNATCPHKRCVGLSYREARDPQVNMQPAPNGNVRGPLRSQTMSNPCESRCRSKNDAGASAWHKMSTKHVLATSTSAGAEAEKYIAEVIFGVGDSVHSRKHSEGLISSRIYGSQNSHHLAPVTGWSGGLARSSLIGDAPRWPRDAV